MRVLHEPPGANPVADVELFAGGDLDACAGSGGHCAGRDSVPKVDGSPTGSRVDEPDVDGLSWGYVRHSLEVGVDRFCGAGDCVRRHRKRASAFSDDRLVGPLDDIGIVAHLSP